MKKIVGAVGQGFVGNSITTVMTERGFDVYAYDKAGKYSASAKHKPVVNSTLSPWFYSINELVVHLENQANFSGVIFVCVPTPMFEDGECDTSIVESVLKEIATAEPTWREGKPIPVNRIAVVKSTVPPGSVERWNKQFGEMGLHVIFSPEFLTEANALDDMRNQNRIILGGPRPWINTVKRLFETAFPNVPIIKTSSSTAEMVKYVTNVHLAVKVLLANEFYQICEALDKNGLNLDFDKVVEYATMDERLGKSHWKVPGPMPMDDGSHSPAFGISGSCFPKDLNALISLAKSIGVKPTIMKAAWEKNLEVRPQRDWLKLVGRAISKKQN